MWSSSLVLSVLGAVYNGVWLVQHGSSLTWLQLVVRLGQVHPPAVSWIIPTPSILQMLG